MSMYKKCFTSGVFDLLHFGHLKILKKCKEISDIVIVGVQEDKDVFNSKRKYPILKCKERIKTLEMLPFVNKCVSYKGSTQNIKTLTTIIKKVKPDLILQGNDWKPDKKIKTLLKNNNIKLILMPYTKSISTSIIKQRANGSV